MRKRSALLAALLTLVLVIGAAPTASAQHYVWLMENGYYQQSFSGYENYVNWWVMQNSSIWYWADTTTDTWATDAVTSWSNIIDQVVTYKVSTKSSADVTYEVGTCTKGIACAALVEVYSDPDRLANYTLTTRIRMDTSKIDAGWEEQVAAHEFGHHIGFDDQYQESPVACNPNGVTTIMDAEGCNTLWGPSYTDYTRFNAFYGDGAASNVQYQILSGSYVTITWKDQSAGERFYEVIFSDYGTGNQVDRVEVTSNIGLKAGLSWVSDRTISYRWVPPSKGSYRACVRPYFAAFAKYGTQACSSGFYYN